ncbi:phosphotransferase family protein [Actinosynnema sp. NPDC059797]
MEGSGGNRLTWAEVPGHVRAAVEAGIGDEPDEFSGWARLAADPAPGVDPWALDRLDELVELESRWAAATAGTSLVHADLRADNALLTSSGDVVFVDWTGAAAGAPWVDLVLMLPSVAMQGGPEPQEVWRTSPLARDADPDAVTSVVAAITGYFAHRSLQPAPPGLPTLRPFQAAQGRPALRWLRQRLG